MLETETAWPAGLFDDLDRTGPVPMYFQVSTRMEEAIRSGAVPRGARIENELAFGVSVGLSRPTVRRAIQELVDKGLVVRRRGIGTQVVQGSFTRQVELTSLYEDLAGAQLAPTTRVLDHSMRAADDDTARQLGVAPGSELLHLHRVRLSDGVAVAVLENHLPPEFHDISAAELGERGLYQALRSRGVAIRVATQRIGARSATAHEAEQLAVDTAAPVLTVHRVAFDASGRAVELGQHVYRSDLYSFETTLVAR
jgi:DNA-binding GntR family transcriptional regulator